ASKETWVKAVLPWRTWMRNQWIMAAGVKRQLSHHEWPAWRQAWWMKSQPSLAARSCLRVLRVVEIRRCIAGPPGPWWVRKIPLCTGVPLFSRDEAAWGYRCLNAIRVMTLFPRTLALCRVIDKCRASWGAGTARSMEPRTPVSPVRLDRTVTSAFFSRRGPLARSSFQRRMRRYCREEIATPRRSDHTLGSEGLCTHFHRASRLVLGERPLFPH